MLIPVSDGKPAAEYQRLMTRGSQWDVGVERQIQIEGPDAAKLTQILYVRNPTKCVYGRGKYVPMCDHRRVLINDPVVLKLSEDCFWLADTSVEGIPVIVG